MTKRIAWRLGDRARDPKSGATWIVTHLVDGWDGPEPVFPAGLVHDFGATLERAPLTLADRLRWRVACALGLDTVLEAVSGLRGSLHRSEVASYASNRRCQDCTYAGRACDHKTG